MQADIEKEIRNIIEYHCGGTYPSRQKATELILQIYKDQRLHVRIYKYLKTLKNNFTLNSVISIFNNDSHKIVRELYNDKQSEQTKPKQFLCGNEYRNKEKRCLKQCGNCQGNV